MRRKHTLYLALVISVILCASSENKYLFSEPQNESVVKEIPAEGSDFYNVANSDMKEVASGNNNFGIKIFNELYKNRNNENLLISPYSISSVFNMVYFGSDGETKKEMRKIFGYDNINDDTLKKTFKNLMIMLKNQDRNVRFEIANSIWSHKSIKLKNEFKNINMKYLDAETYSEDFGAPETVDKINAWVAEKTNDKIDSIIDELNGSEIMALINAIYFYGSWEKPFDKKLTKKQDFTKLDGKKVSKDFMTQSGKYSYLENDNFQAVALPYSKGTFSMYIFLPRKNSSLEDCLKDLNNDNWNKWTSSMTRKKGVVKIPKFKIEFGPEELSNNLQQIGLKNPFTSAANFSKIAGEKMQISRVLHKTFMDVHEKGTEAAAVTVILMKMGSMPSPQKEKPFEFVADHPFFFAIANSTTGSILFMGTLTEPIQE